MEEGGAQRVYLLLLTVGRREIMVFSCVPTAEPTKNQQLWKHGHADDPCKAQWVTKQHE